MNEQALKLLARDVQDVQIMAAMLQDAIVPVSDMAFRSSEKVFVMIAQRFCWDCLNNDDNTLAASEDEPALQIYQRIHCALEVDGVESAQCIGIDHDKPGELLDLLTINAEGNSVRFIFAGGGKLRLNLKDWQIRMVDYGESWPTTHCPRHLT